MQPYTENSEEILKSGVNAENASFAGSTILSILSLNLNLVSEFAVVILIIFRIFTY